jgi:hypothetical protein
MKNRMMGRILSIVSVCVLLAATVPIFAVAESTVSNLWAEKGVDIRVEPHYSNIIYTLDPLEVVWRFDDVGSGYVPATSVIDDSKLNLTGATNASLEVSRDANLNDGTYYEIRTMLYETSGNLSFQLTDAGASETVKIMMGATAKIYYSVPVTASTTVGVLLATFTAGTWYRLGIWYTSTTAMTFVVYADADYTVLGSASVTGANVTYSEIDKLNITQGVGAKHALVDHFAQTNGHSSLVPTSTASNALKLQTDEDVRSYHLVYEIANVGDFATLSNDTAVETAIGYTPTGISITNDNDLNGTDIGEILMETSEDQDKTFEGTSEVKGWKSLSDSMDDSILSYLADRHDVPTASIGLIDYYADDVAFNITSTAAMQDKIVKSGTKNFMSIAKDHNGKVTYSEEPGYWTNWRDFTSVYIPRDVTPAQWEQMKADYSNGVRKDSVSLVALTQEKPDDVTSSWLERHVTSSILAGQSDLTVDRIWQATNAFLGNVIRGEGTAVDAEDLDTAMAHTSSGWDTIEDGKAVDQPLSMAVVYSSALDYAVYIVIGGIIVAAVIAAIVLMAKKRST